MSRRRLVLALVALGCALGAATAYAAFSKTSSNASNVVTAQRIFQTTKSSTAWRVNDQADGSAADQTDQGAIAGDGRTADSGAFGTAFSATRYFDTTYIDHLPPNVSLTGVNFNLNFRPNTSTDTACFYIETRRTSTGALIQQHGDSANPLGCATGSSFTTTSTPLPEIATSADANDLTVRVYARNSGARPITIDLGTVSGTASNGFGSFTLYEVNYLDRSTGTAANFPWGPAKVDLTSQTYSNWTNAFGASRYITFTFPDDLVPSGATIASVDLASTFKSNANNRVTCLYYEIYDGATLIASRDSATTPSCSVTGGSYTTDSYSLTEVNTAAELNGLAVRIYGRDTGSNRSILDRVTLTFTYSLD